MRIAPIWIQPLTPIFSPPGSFEPPNSLAPRGASMVGPLVLSVIRLTPHDGSSREAHADPNDVRKLTSEPGTRGE